MPYSTIGCYLPTSMLNLLSHYYSTETCKGNCAFDHLHRGTSCSCEGNCQKMEFKLQSLAHWANTPTTKPPGQLSRLGTKQERQSQYILINMQTPIINLGISSSHFIMESLKVLISSVHCPLRIPQNNLVNIQEKMSVVVYTVCVTLHGWIKSGNKVPNKFKFTSIHSRCA